MFERRYFCWRLLVAVLFLTIGTVQGEESVVPEAAPQQVNPVALEREGREGKPLSLVKQREVVEESILPQLKPEEAIITVNGDAITWRAMLRHSELMLAEMPLPPGVSMAEFEEKRDDLIMRRIMRLSENYIVKTLFAQEARRNKISVTAGEVKQKLDEILAGAAKNRKNPHIYVEEFSRPDSYISLDITNSLLFTKLREEVIKPAIKVGDSDIKEAIKKRLDTIEEYKKYNATLRPKLEKIRQGIVAGDDFAEIAFSESDCDSSHDGGDLGTLKRDDMLDEIMDAAFALEEGALSDIVETPFSYHIIRVDKRNSGFLAEGDKGPAPVVSVKMAHIMLEKKELPAPHTAETAWQECRERFENEAVAAMRERLLKEAKIDTPLKLY